MIGTKLVHYEIKTHLGSGGMGDVYQATDSKLGRSVAIKFLPEAFSHDTERVARFQREARVLASLNHSNIAAIYGVEETDSRHFLVMELVAGETLADRIKRGAIPIEEALPIAKQIAEALEEAHEKGIIHRDLKPANIKLTPDGKVKVLDFGLAKAYESEQANVALSHSPTISMAATNAGVILGTAAYMSPEQARGRAVDKRTDIWAFGCVLYEILTGQQAFDGEDVTDVIARVVRDEPKWDALPTNIPSKIRQLLARCLTKDVTRRLRDIGDGRMEIEEARSSPADTLQKKAGTAWLGWAVAAAVALVAGAIGLNTLLHRSDSQSLNRNSQSIRFSLAPPKGWRFFQPPFAEEIAISPDSQKMAFTVESEVGDYRVAVRAINSVDSEVVAGTEGGHDPFWSPDGRYIAFEAGDKLKRIELSSGVVQIICDAPGFVWGTWGSNGTIIFSNGLSSGELFRVPDIGGKPVPITVVARDRGEIAHFYPQFLGDARHYLYSVFRPPDEMPIMFATLDSKDVHQISSADSMAQFAAGYLFFVRRGKLVAQRFDERKLQLAGDAVLLAEPVWVNPGANFPGFGVSSDLLAFELGEVPETQLVWIDRSGREIGAVGTKDQYIAASLSPLETEAAVIRFDPSSRDFDVWTIDGKIGTPSRLTFDPGMESFPIWSPNSDSIAFGGWADIRKKPANGSRQAETIQEANGWMILSSWSKDGRYIAYTTGTATGGDIDVLPLDGDKKPIPFLHERFGENNPQISPDSRWMAYESNESGRPEIYVVSFPKQEGKWQISAMGGTKPKWRQDGKELFFLSPSNQLMAVDVNGSGTTLQKGVPKPLFKVPGPRNPLSLFYNYDVAQNGQRFLFNRVLDSSEPPTITVISNWQALLK